MAATISRYRRTIIYFGVFFLAMLINLVSFGVPYWEEAHTESEGNRTCVHRGLWRRCEFGRCLQWGIEEDSHQAPGYVVTTQAAMCVCLVLAFMAGVCFTAWITQHKDQKLMALTCIMISSSGLSNIAAVLVFAFVRSSGTVDPFALHWGYWMGVTSAVLFTSLGVVLTLDRCVFTSLVHQLADVPNNMHTYQASMAKRQSSQDISDYFAKVSRQESGMKMSEKRNHGYLASESSNGFHPSNDRGLDSSNGSLFQGARPKSMVSTISDTRGEAYPDIPMGHIGSRHGKENDGYSQHVPGYLSTSGAGQLS